MGVATGWEWVCKKATGLNYTSPVDSIEWNWKSKSKKKTAESK